MHKTVCKSAQIVSISFKTLLRKCYIKHKTEQFYANRYNKSEQVLKHMKEKSYRVAHLPLHRNSFQTLNMEERILNTSCKTQWPLTTGLIIYLYFTFHA